MPITSSDIQFRLSIPTAVAGDVLAQGTPAASLGLYLATTTWAGGVAGDLYDGITPAQQDAGVSLYRAVFLLNTHATLTLLDACAYISSQTAGGGDLAIGIDPTAATVKTSSPAQAVAVASQTTAPIGVVFSAPTTPATGLSLGNIPPGYCRCLWFRLTGGGPGSIPLSPDEGTLVIRGQTYS